MTTAQNTMNCSIQADGLMKWFGRTQAVNDVSMSIDGGVVGLLGPNGAGKTTVLRMVATVLAPTNGSLRLLGLRPGSPSRTRRDPPPAGLPAPDTDAVPRVHRLRAPRLRRSAQGTHRPDLASRRGATGAGVGWHGEHGAPKDPEALRRDAAAGRARRRDARQPRPAGARRARERARPRAAARAAFPPVAVRAPW